MLQPGQDARVAADEKKAESGRNGRPGRTRTDGKREKMAQRGKKKRMTGKEAAERAELEAYAAERSKKRKSLLKTIVLVLLCVALALSFCLPSLSMLLSR